MKLTKFSFQDEPILDARADSAGTPALSDSLGLGLKQIRNPQSEFRNRNYVHRNH
jgi:hypothetical protein